MENMKILNKLLIIRNDLQPKNDNQAMLVDKSLAILEEVIEEVTKEVEMREQFLSECG
jgi:cob(I)alamin adenosyltransferase